MDYSKLYSNLISKRKSSPLQKAPGHEKHHITPKCFGGTDHSSNLVYLTAQEHYHAHHLLVKIYPGHEGLRRAHWIMCHRDGIQITSRVYSNAKKIASEIMVDHWNKEGVREVASAAFTGELNPMFGKFGDQHGAFGHKKSDKSKAQMSESMKRYYRDNPEAASLISKNLSDYYSKHENIQTAKLRKIGVKNPNFGKDITNSLSGEQRLKQKKNAKIAMNRNMPWEKKTWATRCDVYWEKADMIEELLAVGAKKSDIFKELFGSSGTEVWNGCNSIIHRLENGWSPKTCIKWQERYAKLVSADPPTFVKVPTTKKLF